MLDYIGVDWESQLLVLTKVDRPHKTVSLSQLRQPIYKALTAKWKCYQSHLRPLLRATNARIVWLPIKMLRLPAPAMLNNSVEHYKAGQFFKAESGFKELLLHLPKHAAANFMLGLVYAQKGYLQAAIKYMASALGIDMGDKI